MNVVIQVPSMNPRVGECDAYDVDLSRAGGKGAEEIADDFRRRLGLELRSLQVLTTDGDWVVFGPEECARMRVTVRP